MPSCGGGGIDRKNHSSMNGEGKVAFLFPGQGSQHPGMGREAAERYPVAREAFERADRALSFPISIMTLGLVAFVINAAMLLLVALASDALKLGFKLGTFPPTLNSDAIIGALVGAVIISVVSTVASIALSPRKLI